MKLHTALTGAILLAFVGSAFAQKSGHSTPHKGAMHHASPKMNSVSGIVKGAPMGMKFMLTNKKGTYTVDASKAKCMMMGKACPVKDLKAGTMVTVMGTMKGMTVMASSVKVTHAPMIKKPVMHKATPKSPSKKHG